MSMIAAGGSGIIPVYAFASLPAAGIIGRQAFCSNFGTKGNTLQDDGTRWKPLNGQALLASLDADSGTGGAAETIMFQYQIPAALLQVGDRLRLRLTMSKSGTAEVGNMKFRMGTAGTTSDTQLYSGAGIMSAPNRTMAVDLDFRVASATSLQQLSNNAAQSSSIGYSGNGNNAYGAAVTISNISNALYFTVSGLTVVGTDTVMLREAELWYASKAN